MHTDETLTLLDTIMERLGQRLRRFQLKTCDAFNTQELKREAECRQRRAQENLKNLQGCSTATVAAPTPHASRRPKDFQFADIQAACTRRLLEFNTHVWNN